MSLCSAGLPRVLDHLSDYQARESRCACCLRRAEVVKKPHHSWMWRWPEQLSKETRRKWGGKCFTRLTLSLWSCVWGGWSEMIPRNMLKEQIELGVGAINSAQSQQTPEIHSYLVWLLGGNKGCSAVFQKPSRHYCLGTHLLLMHSVLPFFMASFDSCPLLLFYTIHSKKCSDSHSERKINSEMQSS